MDGKRRDFRRGPRSSFRRQSGRCPGRAGLAARTLTPGCADFSVSRAFLRTACRAGVRNSSGTGDLLLVWRLNFFVRWLRDLFSASLGHPSPWTRTNPRACFVRTPPTHPVPPEGHRPLGRGTTKRARSGAQGSSARPGPDGRGWWLPEAGRGSGMLVVPRNASLDYVSKLPSLSISLPFARPWNLGWGRVQLLVLKPFPTQEMAGIAVQLVLKGSCSWILPVTDTWIHELS